jgi:glycerol kinase
MEADSEIKLALLKVDGGMSLNSLLMEIQADTVQVPVALPQEVETTALGAAFAAGLAVGVWESIEALQGVNPVQHTYTPQADGASTEVKLSRWKDVVQRTLNLA